MRLEDTTDTPKNVFERKRTRSSLDVKVPDGEHLTRPPNSKSKPHLDFSDLNSMSKEEMLQAMYDDPELAAAAAAAAAADQQGTFQKRKSPSRTVDDKVEKLRVKKENGVPIIQWIIILLLLGAVFFKLHKSSAEATVKKVGKTKPDKPRKIGKQKGGKKPKAANKSPTTVVQDASLKTTAAVSGKANAAKNKKALSKKNGKMAKPEAMKKLEQPPLETRGNESPDSASTDGSSSTDGAAQHEEEVAAERHVVSNVIEAVAQAAEDDDGWQTVGSPVVESKPKDLVPTNGKSKGPDAESIFPEPSANGNVEEEEEEEAHVLEEEVLLEEVLEEEKAPMEKVPMSNGSGALPAVMSIQPVTEPIKVKSPKKKKKKAKNSTEEDVTPISVPFAPVENDEALAMQLQLQEEKIAEHEATRVVEEDVWEEVTNKKKKREA